MKRSPTLRGRYEGSVFSPLQWGVLAAVGYALLMGLQIQQLFATSFRIELFDHEVVRVERAAQPALDARPWTPRESFPVIRAVTPLDWPAPPPPTDWSPVWSDPEAVPALLCDV